MNHAPDLSHTLSSQARFRVLQVLSPLNLGLKLRELERACALNVRSIQLATQALVQEGVLRKNSNGHFVLNKKSKISAQLRGLFKYLWDQKTREEAHALSSRAQAVMRLSEQVSVLVRAGNRSSETR